MRLIISSFLCFFLFTSCSSFKAQRVSAEKSDDLAMEITDNWVAADTTKVVQDILKQLQTHKGYQRGMSKFSGKPPALFIGEVQNETSAPYFPISEINDELLNEFSASGEFQLVDVQARSSLLKEITYQNDGMVDSATVKEIGRQTGADWIIFGSVYMKPEKRDGKTIKEYSVNLRMTDIQSGLEVARVRSKIYKYSKQNSSGW